MVLRAAATTAGTEKLAGVRILGMEAAAHLASPLGDFNALCNETFLFRSQWGVQGSALVMLFSQTTTIRHKNNVKVLGSNSRTTAWPHVQPRSYPA